MAISVTSRLWRLGDWLVHLGSSVLHPFARKERVVTIGGFDVFIRRGTSDLFIAREALAHDDYRVVPKGTVVDLGANIGAFSLLASKAAVRVIALEPDPENYGQLKKNLRQNKVENVIALRRAIGGHDGEGVLHLARFNKGSSSTIVDLSGESVAIEVCTLGALMLEQDIDKIDLLKVDIEGSEYALFDEMGADELSRIDRIVMETHKVGGFKPEDISSKLEAHGFSVERRRTILSLGGLDYLYATRIGVAGTP